jgi:hypothetical protein
MSGICRRLPIESRKWSGGMIQHGLSRGSPSRDSVFLNRAQLKFLRAHFTLSTSISAQLAEAYLNAGRISLEVGEELYELCADDLPVFGFDDDYRLTEAGEMLESVMDRIWDQLIDS